MAKKVFVFETWSGRSVQASGTTPDELLFSEWDWPGKEPAISVPDDAYDLLSTEESRATVEWIEKKGASVVTLARAEAIFWAYRDQMSRDTCLILSIGAETGWAWIIAEGKIANSWQGPELSVRQFWKASLESHPQRKLLYQTFRDRNDPQFDEKIQIAVLDALRGAGAVQAGPLSFLPPLDFSAGAHLLDVPILAIDPGRRADTVILTDFGAAHCNLGDLLKKRLEGSHTVLVPPPQEAPFLVLAGLAQYHRRHLLRQLPPRLEVSPDRLDFGILQESGPTTAPIRIDNTGGAAVAAEITSDQMWLAPVPARLQCEAGRRYDVAVGVDPSRLPPGPDQHGSLTVNWDLQGEPQSLIVTVAARKPAPPVLSCPNSDCRKFRVDGRQDCPICRTPLAPASLEILEDKARVAAKNWGSFLGEASSLLEDAERSGLQASEASARIDQVCIEACGSTLGQFRSWVAERNRLLRSGADSGEARGILLAMADSIGLHQSLAQDMVAEHWAAKPRPPTPPIPTAASGPPLRLILGAVLLVAVLVVVLFNAFGPLTNTACPDNSPGDLVLHLSPAANAMLDGFELPQGGQRVGESHQFQNVSAGTHLVRVWREGYIDQSRTVTIEPCGTAEESFALRPK